VTSSGAAASIRQAMPRRIGLDIRKVPQAIVEAVETDARERDLSRNEAITRVLSLRYGVPWESTGRKYSEADGTTDHWQLRLPVTLHGAIRAHADALPGGTGPGVVLYALSDHYGLEPQSPRKRIARLSPAIIREARRRKDSGESVRSIARDLHVNRNSLNKALREELAA
jgi:hypothetical protein